MTGALLTGKELTAGYGQVQVLRGVDVDLYPGKVTVLLGSNGAGKSTTLLTLAGELAPSTGSVAFAELSTRRALHTRARSGLSFVAEDRSIFRSLTTRENIKVGRVSVDAVLELFPELQSRLDVRAGLLSGGEQQMLSLGRALARHPQVLLADELSLGLAPLVVERLFTAVRAAADERGLATLLVEQQIHRALRYADHVYVLRRGEVVYSGTGEQARTDVSSIEAAYLEHGR